MLAAIGVSGLVFAIRDGETLSTSNPSWRLVVFGLVTWSAFVALVGAFMSVKEMRRVASLPDGGLILTERSMLDVYGKYGLAESRLATPTIIHDDDEGGGYDVHRHGFDALWYSDGSGLLGGPSDADDGVRSYGLWWRDDAYPNLKHDVSFGVNDKPNSDTNIVSERYMDKFQREGVDLRM